MKSLSKKTKKLAESGTLNPHAEKINDPLFKDHPFFDAEDLLQAKYEMLRRVEKEGESVTDAANAFGFSRRHFYVLQKKLSDEGLHGLLSEKRGPKDAHKLNEKVMSFIEALMEKDPTLTSTKLNAEIDRKFGIKTHTRSIERALLRQKKRQKS